MAPSDNSCRSYHVNAQHPPHTTGRSIIHEWLVPPRASLGGRLSSRLINSNEPSLYISPSFFFVYHTEADRVLPHDLHRPCLVSSEVLLHSALMVVTGLGSPTLCLSRLPWGLSGSPSTSQAYYLRSLSYQLRRYRGWRPTNNVYRNKQNTYLGFLSLTYLNKLYGIYYNIEKPGVCFRPAHK